MFYLNIRSYTHSYTLELRKHEGVRNYPHEGVTLDTILYFKSLTTTKLVLDGPKPACDLHEYLSLWEELRSPHKAYGRMGLSVAESNVTRSMAQGKISLILADARLKPL